MMDWPISALYNLSKMPCNHYLKANRTNWLAIYYKIVILPLTDISTRLLYTFKGIMCLYCLNKVSVFHQKVW